MLERHQNDGNYLMSTEQVIFGDIVDHNNDDRTSNENNSTNVIDFDGEYPFFICHTNDHAVDPICNTTENDIIELDSDEDQVLENALAPAYLHDNRLGCENSLAFNAANQRMICNTTENDIIDLDSDEDQVLENALAPSYLHDNRLGCENSLAFNAANQRMMFDDIITLSDDEEKNVLDQNETESKNFGLSYANGYDPDDNPNNNNNGLTGTNDPYLCHNRNEFPIKTEIMSMETIPFPGLEFNDIDNINCNYLDHCKLEDIMIKEEVVSLDGFDDSPPNSPKCSQTAAFFVPKSEIRIKEEVLSGDEAEAYENFSSLQGVCEVNQIKVEPAANNDSDDEFVTNHTSINGNDEITIKEEVMSEDEAEAEANLARYVRTFHEDAQLDEEEEACAINNKSPSEIVNKMCVDDTSMNGNASNDEVEQYDENQEDRDNSNCIFSNGTFYTTTIISCAASNNTQEEESHISKEKKPITGAEVSANFSRFLMMAYDAKQLKAEQQAASAAVNDNSENFENDILMISDDDSDYDNADANKENFNGNNVENINIMKEEKIEIKEEAEQEANSTLQWHDDIKDECMSNKELEVQAASKQVSFLQINESNNCRIFLTAGEIEDAHIFQIINPIDDIIIDSADTSLTLNKNGNAAVNNLTSYTKDEYLEQKKVCSDLSVAKCINTLVKNDKITINKFHNCNVELNIKSDIDQANIINKIDLNEKILDPLTLGIYEPMKAEGIHAQNDNNTEETDGAMWIAENEDIGISVQSYKNAIDKLMQSVTQPNCEYFQLIQEFSQTLVLPSIYLDHKMTALCFCSECHGINSLRFRDWAYFKLNAEIVNTSFKNSVLKMQNGHGNWIPHYYKTSVENVRTILDVGHLLVNDYYKNGTTDSNGSDNNVPKDEPSHSIELHISPNAKTMRFDQSKILVYRRKKYRIYTAFEVYVRRQSLSRSIPNLRKNVAPSLAQELGYSSDDMLHKIQCKKPDNLDEDEDDDDELSSGEDAIIRTKSPNGTIEQQTSSGLTFNFRGLTEPNITKIDIDSDEIEITTENTNNIDNFSTEQNYGSSRIEHKHNIDVAAVALAALDKSPIEENIWYTKDPDSCVITAVLFRVKLLANDQ